MPLTLAHLSDLHLSPVVGFTPAHWNVKRALGYANWIARRRHVHATVVTNRIVADIMAHAPDHIAVTGDLVNLGLPGELAAATRWLGTLGGPDRVSVIPGNHDIYTPLGADPGVARWQDYMTSDAWGGQFGYAGFPYVRRLRHVALIGLNSAHPTPPFVAAGGLGHEQLAALERVLVDVKQTGLARVVLIHHPPLPGQAPPRRALADADRLAAVLERAGAELVLHGHNHRDMVALVGVRIPVVGVGSGSAAKPYKHEPAARWNLVRIDEALDGRFPISVEVRGLNGDGEVGPIGRHAWL